MITYVNITKSLAINQILSEKVNAHGDKIDKIVCMFQNHPSILKIKKSCTITNIYNKFKCSYNERNEEIYTSSSSKRIKTPLKAISQLKY